MGSSSSPCAGCKILRRKCTAECVLAPYFPPDQPQKFVCVHKMFGASNVAKILNALPLQHREDAVNSLAYEADARLKDPVYGCVGAITKLQRQIAELQHQLANAKADLAHYTGRTDSDYGNVIPFQGSASASGTAPAAEGNFKGTGQHRAENTTKWEQSPETWINKHFTRDDMLELSRLGGGSYQAGLTPARLAGGAGTIAPFLPHRLMNSFDNENSGVREGLGI